MVFLILWRSQKIEWRSHQINKDLAKSGGALIESGAIFTGSRKISNTEERRGGEELRTKLDPIGLGF